MKVYHIELLFLYSSIDKENKKLNWLIDWFDV
jgi:hypothetical protein